MQIILKPLENIKKFIGTSELIDFDIGTKQEILIQSKQSDKYKLHLLRNGQYSNIEIDFESDFLQFHDEKYILISEDDNYNSEIIYIDIAGKITNRFNCGNDLSDFKALNSNELWLCYNDLGINNGFINGLYCYNIDGLIKYRYSPQKQYSGLADCYSINEFNDSIWLYYYSNILQDRYYLTSISNKSKIIGHTWETVDFLGFDFLVSEDKVLFLDYSENNFTLLNLSESKTLSTCSKISFTYENQELKKPLIRTRANKIYFLENGFLYSYSVT